jgi:hypothetical protein
VLQVNGCDAPNSILALLALAGVPRLPEIVAMIDDVEHDRTVLAMSGRKELGF